MIMLSRLLQFGLIDESQRQAKLADLAIDLEAGDYPPVSGLIYINPQKTQSVLPWGEVGNVNLQRCRLHVSDLDRGKAITPEDAKSIVLLKRDVLDAMVLDLHNRRATRANDLLLQEEDNRLSLIAADTGAQAILRRISRGWLGRRAGQDLYDWQYIEFLHGDPSAARRKSGYYRRIVRLLPGQIASLTDALPYLHAAELLVLLPDPLAADTLEAMTPERQLQVFEELDEKQALALLALMAPDIATDLVGRLQPEMARHYLESLPRSRAERIVELLRYPEDTVGGMMTNDTVMAPANITVAEACAMLAPRLKEPDFVYFIYIVENETERKLCGVVTLRDLLVAGADCEIRKVMNPYVVSLHPLDSAREAAFRVIDSHLAALPVTGDNGQLLGAVTVDSALSQVIPDNWGASLPRVFS